MDKKISQLTAASTPLTGTEELAIVQSGSTVKATAQDVADLGGGSTYKVYSAIGSYSAGGFSVQQILENTLGATITWGTSGTFGVSSAGTASSSVFTINKTVVIATPYTTSLGGNIFVTIGSRASGTLVNLFSISTQNGQTSTAYGGPFFLEIRVYP